MRSAKYFSKADAKSGFFQIPVEIKSKPKLAFSDGKRKFTWNFMPMGISNAPMVFSKIMQQILGDLEFVTLYIDDVCIFSESIEEHLEHLKIVMERLEKANIKLNPDKCVWFTQRVELLGHVITPGGIAPNPKKCDTIEKRLRPKNIKELRGFLGMCNYYRCYVKNFADIALPLYALLKEGVYYEWTQECDEAFNELKK